MYTKVFLLYNQDIPKDRIVSFYGGIRMRTDEMTDSKEDYDANAYKIMDMCGPGNDSMDQNLFCIHITLTVCQARL